MKNWKPVFAVLLNILAVTGPVAALYVRYGLEERVSAHEAGQLVALAGAMLSGFALAFVAGHLLRQIQDSYTSVLGSIAQALHHQRRHTV